MLDTYSVDRRIEFEFEIGAQLATKWVLLLKIKQIDIKILLLLLK